VNLVYAPVAGLTIGAEVEYKYVNFKITDRINRRHGWSAARAAELLNAVS
jgi:hypothetical protein